MPSSERASEFIEIHLFAAAADQVGTRKLRLPWVPTANIDDLARELCKLYPSIEPIVRSSRWAVDKKFVPLSTPVERQQEIALIPPVSGG